MRTAAIAGFVLVAIASSLPIDARCAPYAAYVYDGLVEYCRPSHGPEPIALVTVCVSRMAQVAECDWEESCKPAVRPWLEITPEEVRFQTPGSCADGGWVDGKDAKFYAVRPCCDVFPTRGARCVLGFDVILDPPEWALELLQKK